MPEKSYASDCRVFTPENPDNMIANVWDATYDVHFVAHLFGWWFKMMIIRDVKACWICSVVFELLEISFRHWLPNFWECWWDHVIYNLTNFSVAPSGHIWMQSSGHRSRSVHM